MDLRVEAEDESAWVELRDVRLTDGDGAFCALLRASLDGRVHSRPFWFDHADLTTFLREAERLASSISGESTFNHAGRPEYLTLARDPRGWWLGGEIFDFEDPEDHVRFRFALSASAAGAMLREMRAVTWMRAPSG